MSKTIADLPVARYDFDAIVADGTFPSMLAHFAAEHGPVFKRSAPEEMDGSEIVYMVGPEANRFVMHTRRQHFSHEQGWTPLIGEDFGRGLLNMDDPEHAVQRKLWNPAFSQAYIATYMPIMQQVITQRTAEWAGHDEIDLYHEARELTFEITAAALAGFRPGPETDHLRGLFYEMLHGFDPEQTSFDEFWARRAQVRKELVTALLGMIAARRAAPAAQPPRDVLDAIIYSQDEQGRTLDDAQVLAHLNILLIAGHETTTTLAAWTLFLLSTLPEQREQIEAELAELPGPAGIEGLRAARRLDWFIRETGRLYSPVINVPRGVVEPFEFGGYHIPAGVPVRLCLAAGHRLPGVFADPERFDPLRFAPPREEDRRNQYGLVTFGGGPRVCIGINFAQVEVRALVAHVLRNYRLEPVAGTPPVHVGYWTAEIRGDIKVRMRAK